MKWRRAVEHDGDSVTTHARLTFLRRLTLTGPDGRRFLDRRGIDLHWFGVYVHRIDAPDPGVDLHDHPWPAVSIILRGGYTEEWSEAREAPWLAKIADVLGGGPARGYVRTWRAGTVHRIRMTDAHRITDVRPHTWTLLLRGRKSRSWGFYLPSTNGFTDQRSYDYAARRPLQETR
jgi:hypothetical protein